MRVHLECGAPPPVYLVAARRGFNSTIIGRLSGTRATRIRRVNWKAAPGHRQRKRRERAALQTEAVGLVLQTGEYLFPELVLADTGLRRKESDAR